MKNNVGVYVENKFNNPYFYIHECGFETVKTRELYEYEPIDYYLIHFVTEGSGFVSINGHEKIISAGQGFIIPPHTPNNYYTFKEDPWFYRWIGFKGHQSINLFNECGLLLNNQDSSYFFDFEDLFQMDNLFSTLYYHSTRNEPYLALSTAYEIVHALTHNFLSQNTFTTKNEEYVLQATRLIENNYFDSSFTISTLSNEIHIERSYLYRTFNKQLGISPKEYLSQYRLAKACELLRKSTLTIEDIAYSVGFNSHTHFSRQFQKSMQVTPTSFRNTYLKVN